MKTPWNTFGCLLLLLTLIAVSACKPEPDKPVVTPKPANFQVELDMKWGADDLLLNQNYLGPDGRQYKFETLQCFLSNLSLIKPSNSTQLVNKVALLDMNYPTASTLISGSVPAGSYTGISFSLGLDSALNHSDPSLYNINHPMSSTTGMFWSWSTQYIFVKIEGRADTTGGHAEDAFLYHCGFDSLKQDLEFRNLNIVLAEAETEKLTLTLDLQKVFFGDNDSLDVAVEGNSQTFDNPDLAMRVIRNLKAAISQ